VDDVSIERSIAEHGIFTPLFVSPIAEKLFEVIDGERRLCFARNLHARGKLSAGFRMIPCQVIETTSDREKALWRVLCNLHSGLASEELDDLSRKAGILLPVYRHDGKEPAGAGPSGLTRIGDLLHGLAERKNAIRSSRRTMEALEITRDYVAGAISHQEAMNRLRFTGSSD
jgi:hypothetical protein